MLSWMLTVDKASERLQLLRSHLLPEAIRQAVIAKSECVPGNLEKLMDYVVSVRRRNSLFAELQELASLGQTRYEYQCLGRYDQLACRPGKLYATISPFFRPGEWIAHGPYLIHDIAILGSRLLVGDGISRIDYIKWLAPITTSIRVEVGLNLDKTTELPVLIGRFVSELGECVNFRCFEIAGEPIDTIGVAAESIELHISKHCSVTAVGDVMIEGCHVSHYATEAQRVMWHLEIINVMARLSMKSHVSNINATSFYTARLRNLCISQHIDRYLNEGITLRHKSRECVVSKNVMTDAINLLHTFFLAPFQIDTEVVLASAGR